MKSTLTPQQTFARTMKPKIQRSVFDRSHGTKTTFNESLLIPVYVDEALPGDSFKMNATLFGRLATPKVPIMDNMFMDIHFFSVPLRLVWNNFQRFMGEQDNPDDTTDYVVPTMISPAPLEEDPGGYGELSLYDYMGIPTKVGNLEHSTLFLRSYNLIWNSWYRDENLQQSVRVNKEDGGDVIGDFNVLRRGKRKDYFTSALPWAQKGEPSTLPLPSANVYGSLVENLGTGPSSVSNYNLFTGTDDGNNPAYGNVIVGADGHLVGDPLLTNKKGLGLATKEQYDLDPNATPPYIEYAEDTLITVSAIREAVQIQKFLERDARGGTRYTELIRSHFGVISSDARLQRPEFLGGGTVPININPIAQTSSSEDGTTPQANLAAFGTVGASHKGFNKTFTEHEIIIGLVSVRADLNYQNGLNRMWSRQTKYDFYWPTFAHLSEQAILNKELYATGNNQPTDLDNMAFGYQERYGEYRYKPSLITGLFRSNSTQPLDVWHLAQEYDMLPALNEEFITEDPAVDRVIAVPSQPHFLLDCYFDLKCARPMPTISIPGLMDHF